MKNVYCKNCKYFKSEIIADGENYYGHAELMNGHTYFYCGRGCDRIFDKE